MGISISGSNSISGLSGNDTDFDKVLEQLKQIESTNINRLEAWKSDWNLRYESFTKIIEQIQIASNLLGNLSDKNNFVSKLVQSSNENIITAVANASAQDVQHTINVSQVASNAIWANTGHIFESKTDVINDTGTDQYFKYSYAGKEYKFKVPANTTLESFASMINNSSDNPGIKVSIVRAGQGFVFQVAGKDTGVNNDLIIHSSNLVGMQTTGSTTSTWLTNAPVDPGKNITNPTSFTFDIETDGGVKKSITLKGNETAQQLVDKINNAFGTGVVTASLNDDGSLRLEGVKSFTRRNEKDEKGSVSGIRLELPGAGTSAEAMSKKLNAPTGLAAGKADSDILKFTFEMNDGTSREISISADATYEELVNALGNMSTTIDGGGATFNMKNNGSWGIDLRGVAGISASVIASDDSKADFALSTSKLDSTLKSTSLKGSLSSSELTLTFDKDKLSQRLDGKKEGDSDGDLTFTFVDKEGTARNISIEGNKTYKDLLDEVAKKFGDITPTGDDNNKLVLNNIKSFTQTGGLAKVDGVEASLKATLNIPATVNDEAGKVDPANSLFYADEDGNKTLEKAPDLVYTITTNDGKTGTLTMPSGSTMQQVMAALKSPTASGWQWKDANGNVTSAPSGDFVKLTDADGNEYVDENGKALKVKDIDGPVYISFSNVESASGPGLTGQVATSSNWSIQRSSNAKFTVDNWPIEMESETNSISDAIDGVVFSLQDTGTARISVSTDITSVEQSIQNFLDAVNSVIMTVNELMSYDETKEVTSNDPNDKGNSNYSASGLTNQKGSLLTGNYGVQLFKSRFSSALTTTPPGFKSQSSASDVLSGDLLASLANLGIKTDTDSTSDTYGLLVLAPSSSIAAMQTMDKENYNDMITNHLEAVVDFFCASGIGSSTSTDFRYDSHVEGITKGGTYDVSYEVTKAGEIINVMIGGAEAKRDESMPGYYYTVTSGDAKGLAINIDNLSVGKHPPEGGESMQVRVKQGLVQTVNNFLKGELVFNDVSIPQNATESQIADAIYLKSQNGALMSLRDNYMTVMESIDSKIEREQRRLDTWYNRQKSIFANLETLLSKYSEQQKSLESQLQQLGGNS